MRPPEPPEPGDWVFLAGATGQIGTAVAEVLAKQRVNLVVHDSGRTSGADKLAGQLRALYGVQAVSITADITDAEQLSRMRAELVTRGVASLRAVLNSTTGYPGWPVELTQLSEVEFRRVVDVDLVGSFLLVRSLLPLLVERPGARVVLFSSVAGLRGRPGAAHLCAAKAGIAGLVVALAKELGPRGVAVNAVAPGPVIADESAEHEFPAGVAPSTAQQVADAAVYLASDRSSPIQGQVLVVNGGQP
ncbi:SDR family oxidoreductase [Saccharopolyspora phatthalungensis]|uniref:NAD(P)-dependent dehydrogenase (Short-subunit alcohol dehydrogenase family) n=1 Tax=Saccharopolyspora phatthalungensis TaxID=664693 RepID=A0A840QB80_9PSEU|nr:SDR family oxidoreductase [Saccharopolyspora phatthalungensis]MBB5158014.1 NAD(P)-dependent dehydrogenase (short-subunit alcohol dehydrogenase family) [Saccharopolyspora phatthalungensis]